MKIVGIVFLCLGVLFILFGISIFTPFLSWVGKRFNSSKASSINSRQPSSIRATSMFLSICFFTFGLFITIAGAAFINSANTINNQELSVPQSIPATPETFPSPMISDKKTITPPISDKNEFLSQYGLDCPPDKDGLNMRKQAGLNTEIITVIPCDAFGIEDTKQRYDRDGLKWYLVKYKQNTGWVAGKYLKRQASKREPNENKDNFFSRLVAKKRP